MSQNHDEIVIWADENADSIVRRFAPASLFKWSDREVAAWRSGMGDAEMPPRPEPFIVRKTWEKPILEKFDKLKIAGYVDLSIAFGFWRLDWELQGSSVVPGSVTLQKFEKSSLDESLRVINIEVKPRIESLGEVIRQIRRYQVFVDATWVICSPDTRYKSLIESQQIGFLEAPGNQGSLGF